jgi:hypothetical protein
MNLFFRWELVKYGLASRAVHAKSHKSAISPITETDSMEKFRPYLFWLKGRKSRHQLH